MSCGLAAPCENLSEMRQGNKRRNEQGPGVHARTGPTSTHEFEAGFIGLWYGPDETERRVPLRHKCVCLR